MKAPQRILIVTTQNDFEDRLESLRNLPFMEGNSIFVVSERYGIQKETREPDSTFIIDDLRNHTRIQECVKHLESLAKFDRVISTDEYSILLAAYLRERLWIKGQLPPEAIKFRDKFRMKRALEGSKVRVPNFQSLQEIKARNELGFPIIAKPRTFAGSRGVVRLNSEIELNSFLHEIQKSSETNQVSKGHFDEFSLVDYEFEEYIEGDVFHIDGACHQGRVMFAQPSRYLGSCLDFLCGQPLGSSFVTDENEIRDWTTFTQEVVSAMAAPNGVFHLEAFLTPKGERVFLEFGARPGGALVVPTIREAWKIDLDEIHVALQLDVRPHIPTHPIKRAAGWAVFPKVFKQNYSTKIKSVECKFLERLSTLTWSRIPIKNQNLNDIFSYTDNCGGFIFASDDELRINSEQMRVLSEYKVEVEFV
jgi:hypothetical protein